MLEADMIDLDRERICYADADHLTDLWNAAYPLMRDIVTKRIEAYRECIARKVWEIDPSGPNADWQRMRTPSESQYRRKLKSAEELRLTLGQLDRGTHKPCTRSPGCFSASSAYRAVHNLLSSTSYTTEGLAVVYRLALVLSEMDDRRAEWLRSRNG